MGLINDLHNRPAVMLTLIIIITGISIIIVVIVLLHRLQNEKRVTRAALELKKITNSIGAGLVHFVLEDNCKIIYASDGFYELLGYQKREAREQNKLTLLDFIDFRHHSFSRDVEQQLRSETVQTEVPMIKKNGETIYFLMNGNFTVGKDGKHKLSVVFVDITESKRMQELIVLEGEKYRIVTELSNDILFEYHIMSDQMVYVEKYRDLFDVDPVYENFVKNIENRRKCIHPDDWGVYFEYCRDLKDGKSIIEAQFRIKVKNGTYIWCQTMGKTIYDDYKTPIRVIGKLINVDIQKRELERLEYKATRDPLTDVYNKEITIMKIDQMIAMNQNGNHMLMLVDFDDFKGINDTYGHLTGDKALVHVINKVKETFTEGELIGRIGGDEFVVFAANLSNQSEMNLKADALKSALKTSITAGDTVIPISGSIGVAVYPDSGYTYEQLMMNADQALYKVKEQVKKSYRLNSVND